MSLEELGLVVVDRFVDPRNIKTGEKAADYTSTFSGPIYTHTKESVGQRDILVSLAKELTTKLVQEGKLKFDFIAANESGAMVPGWQLKTTLEKFSFREIPYVYIQKDGNIKGFMNNSLIRENMKVLIFEDAVNFGTTIIKGAELLRKRGYVVDTGACFVYYDHMIARENLARARINLTYLFTLSQLLDIAEKNGRFNPIVIADSREFLADPEKWQRDNGFR